MLAVNTGSSSLKLRLLDGDDAMLASRDLPAPRGTVEEGELVAALAELGDTDAVGHRIVHGGTKFRAPVRLDETVVAELTRLVELAPLHQPAALSVAALVTRTLPDVPAVACFDTAFHAALPAAAATYALPAAWRARWELRRFGFHGLSHAYAARRSAQLLDREKGLLRVVSCHLGAGASLAAIRDGVSVDTTMGFTPLEGLVMATRSGSVDPGLLLWLLEHEGLREAELAAVLEQESGLLALAGTADMAEVVAGAEAGEDQARLAFDVYIHRLRAAIAAMCAAMGGMEALVFTGGVGERSPQVRAAAATGLGFLGIALDDARNRVAGGDQELGADGAPVHLLVVSSREDLEIALQVRRLLTGQA